MQRRAAEVDRFRRLQQGKAQTEALGTRKLAETLQRPDDRNPRLSRKRNGLSYNEALQEARSAFTYKAEITAMDEQGHEARRAEIDSEEISDEELTDKQRLLKRLRKTSESSRRPYPFSKLSFGARDVVRDFIMGFVKMMKQKVYLRLPLWAEHARVLRRSRYAEKWLENALEVYATQLLSTSVAAINAGTSADENELELILFGAIMIQHYKILIAYHYHMRVSRILNSRTDMDALLRSMDLPNFSPERLGLEMDPVFSISHSFQAFSELFGERHMNILEFDRIMDLLASTDEVQLLASCAHQCLYRDCLSAMKMIKLAMSEESLTYHSLGGYQVHIQMPWTMENFILDQYGDISRFGSVLTLTGRSTRHAQASTCADYIRMTWPVTGSFFLELLDGIHAVIVGSGAHESTQVSLTGVHGLSVQAKIYSGPGLAPCATFVAHALDDNLLVELAQQLAWLSSAFTISPSKETLAYSSPLFLRKSQGVFAIEVYHEPIDENACWLPLFNGACIVTGFPIPDRGEEIGLEVSLKLLAGLSGARHVVEYEGGLVMKGFSHMFVPVRRQSERIQWHAVSSPDEETPLSYHDGISRCTSRAMLDEVGFQDLASLRVIVGWCSVAITCLGSSNVNYKNIDYTKTKEADSGPRCTGTSFGFQQFGVAALDVKFGLKDGKSHFQRAGPYQRIIQLAEGSPIVLHDVEGRRSWLVPATNVMLHVVQHRHHLNPFQVNGTSISLDTNVPIGSSAREVLLRNRTQVLYEDDDYTFMDDVLNTWSILEFLLAQNISRQREAPGVPIPSSWHENIYGFEFKAVVLEDAPLKLKKTTISRTHGGWLKLIEDIDALVLFANGFGDVILPADEPDQDLCRKWRRVPHGQDYLTTTTNMLDKLFDKAGSRQDRKYLTTKSKLRWHQGSSTLFNPCRDVNLCDCTRLQQLVPESLIKSAQPPASIADEGAVIFGRPERRCVPLCHTESQKCSSLYSQPNDPILSKSTHQRGSTIDRATEGISRLDMGTNEVSYERNYQLQSIQ
ncbi:unnamed protein product [Alternaria alternata]|jgi:hypothetical protein